jgi:hypothetical protein
MPIHMRGAAAELKALYQPAAQLRAWTLHTIGDSATTQLSAELVSHNARRLAQRPLTFVIQRPRGKSWRWPVLDLRIAGSSLTATLGPQE